MSNYKIAYNIFKVSSPGLKFQIGGGEPPCDLGIDTTSQITKVAPAFNNQKNNCNKTITWLEFQMYANELLFEPSCLNFKEMPDNILSIIFKFKKWDIIRGDEIVNQGIANFLSFNFNGRDLYYFFEKEYNVNLSEEEKYNLNLSNSLNYGFGNFPISTDAVNFINQIDLEGKSSELLTKMYKYKGDLAIGSNSLEDKVKISYITSKAFALSGLEKVIVGLGLISLLYISYKILK